MVKYINNDDGSVKSIVFFYDFDALKDPNMLDIVHLVLKDINTIDQSDKDKIDWSNVSKVFRKFSGTRKCEFNIFRELNSFDDFEAWITEIENGYENKGPFIKRVCKDCGKEFYLFKGQVDFYNNNPKLRLPKRCEDCRRKRKLMDEGILSA